MIVVELYALRDRVILPTIAETPDGIYLEMEPVTVLGASDVQGLEAALRERRARGNPVVAGPGLQGWPRHVVLPYAGVKSNAALQKKARGWGVRLHADGVTVFPYTPYQPGRGDLANRDADVRFGGPDPDREAAEWLVRRFTGG